MSYQELTFRSQDSMCSGWHFAGRDDGTPARPVVVMAHGFGGTKDSGLQPFAEKFSAAGLDVLAFDYRGFGTSEGAPRQSISIKRQEQDYQAAVACAKALPGVDPNRVVLWGVSMSGGHVLRVAAGRDDVVAVIAMTPLTDPLATGAAVLKQHTLGTALRTTVDGVRSRWAVARGRTPVLMKLTSRPGEHGALSLDGAYENYLSIAGPSWRNEVDSGVGFELAKVKTKAAAKSLRAALLIQIADFDRFVPASSIAKTAVHGRAQVHHYPCDHFDVWPGHDWFDQASNDQIGFLARALGPAQLPV
ncbi:MULTISPECIES: alpha/beta hydrolase [Mycobacterium]|uniref:Alpha/beta hydrolase n=1 Tax=Mycobacterium kiyosense TaxID=2871094 RepID=A0A9P3Q7T6_9MYCO|nr:MULTISPECIES: alpha/beta hydrolase [Mycobacterium]BDB43756.1 alpha/beta hydrolase [Mycobacterium kiyosense]BDE15321.1 alpha/beta hydrolase [Mycobacterium sp. 20KCMC460]GLB83985.1 alpha/beta hydrolase [Mycobacterium kiyosense]GLB91489.1 alpha/beta hydrolase [Mycobacterium kiyosense]GLB97368.1 alpha/beta hydrolase [Mycobacterium kiyosense]